MKGKVEWVSLLITEVSLQRKGAVNKIPSDKV